MELLKINEKTKVDSERRFYKDQIDEKRNGLYKAKDTKDTKDTKEVKDSFQVIQKQMSKLLTTGYSEFAPHVNGFYYVHMVNGTWEEDIIGKPKNFTDDFKNSNDFSVFKKEHFTSFNKNFGQFATDIDIPQLNMEFETVSVDLEI